MSSSNVQRAIDLLRAERGATGSYRYYDDATRRWYLASEEELEVLGEILADEGSGGYSEWCSLVEARPEEEA